MLPLCSNTNHSKHTRKIQNKIQKSINTVAEVKIPRRRSRCAWDMRIAMPTWNTPRMKPTLKGWLWMRTSGSWLATHCHSLWRWRLRLSTDRTSPTNRSASSMGRRFSKAVSVASENQDFIGIALSENIPWNYETHDMSVYAILLNSFLRVCNTFTAAK